MKVIQTKLSSNNKTFGAISVASKDVCSTILKGLNEKQLNSLKQNLINQYNNPVNAIIKKYSLGLKAKIICQYKLKNFKENYKQIPFFESNEHFIKRIIKKCEEYKAQLNL